MENFHIYIIFSSTPYRIGRMIRWITREPYNHVSIALREDLKQMYGFARRHYHTPLCGGFVQESSARYQIRGMTADICLCSLPVSAQQYSDLESLLSRMEENKSHYIYNHLSALGALTHKRVEVKDAYTCVEFCVKILHKLGFDVNPKQFYTVCDLQKLLQSYCIYTGKMPQSTQFDENFFAKLPLLHSASVTVRDVFRLIPHYFQNRKQDRD